MGKAGIKRCKWDSKGGVRAQHKSRNWQIKVCQFHPEVNFCKTDFWDRAFSRAKSTGESTDLPAAKEMQLWPEVMREPKIPVLHGQQEPHTQQPISAPTAWSAQRYHSLIMGSNEPFLMAALFCSFRGHCQHPTVQHLLAPKDKD